MAKLKDSRVYGNLTIDEVLTVTKDTTITGNLVVNGTTTTVNSTVTKVVDPIVEQGGGANGAALTSNDNKDRGTLLHYYSGAAPVDAFMGWDNSNAEFSFGGNVTVSGDVVTYNTMGNVRAGVYFGDAYGLSNVQGGNVTGTVAYANYSYFTGDVVNASQSNITSLGTLTGLTVNGISNISAINSNGIANLSNTTVSTSKTTGALTVAGGAGIGGNVWIGGDLNVEGNLAANFVAPGSNTYVMFNDSNIANASAGMTFNKTANAFTITGNILGGNLTTANAVVAGNVTANAFANIGTYANVGTYINVGTYANVGSNLEVGTTANITGNLKAGNVQTTTVKSNTLISYDLTGTRVPFANASNALVDSSQFTFDSGTGTLSVNKANVTLEVAANTIKSRDLTSTRVPFIGAGNAFVDSGNLTFTDNTGTLTAVKLAGTGEIESGNIKANNLTSSRLVVAGVGGLLQNSNVEFSGDQITVGNVNANTAVVAGNLTSNALSTGHVVLAGTNGILTENANITYTGDSLALGNLSATTKVTAANIQSNALSTGHVVLAGTNGILTENANITYTGDSLALGNLSATSNVVAANLTSNALSTGHVVLAGTNGVLTENANITYTGDSLALGNLSATTKVTAANIQSNALHSGYVTFAGAGGLLTDDSSFTFSTSTGLDTGAKNITTTGNVSAANVIASANITASSGNISGNNLSATYTVSAANVAATDSITASNNITATANIQANGNIITDSIRSRTGAVTITSTSGNITFDASTDVIEVSGARLTGLASPSGATDAVNKGYVDGLAQGLDIKESVRTATSSNITLTGTQTIDGVAVVAGDRVLVKSQTTASQNGIYVVASGAWTRADDAVNGKLTAGSFTFVEEGTAYGDTGWVVSTENPITVGSTSIVWTQFSGAGQYIAGDGLALTGTTFSVNVDNTTLEIASDTLKVKDSAQFVTPNIGAATGSSLNLSTGNLTAGNAIIGSGTGGSITGANLVSANYFTGTLTTAAQPNITSVGTLTSLDVTGNVTAGAFKSDTYQYANGVAIDFQTAAGSDYQIQFHKAGVNDLDASANLTFNSSTNELALTGNLTTTNANLGNLAVANYVTGTLTTAAQPNITSVGTLTSLAVTGNLTAGNVTGANLISGSYVAGTLTTAAQPNITSVGTLTSVDVTNAANVGSLKATGNIEGNNATITNNFSAGNITISSGFTTDEIVFVSTGGNLIGSANLKYTPGTNTFGTVNIDASANVVAANVYANNLATSGRVVIAGTSGRLVDNANLSYNTGTDTLSVINISATANVTVGNISGNGAGLTSLTGANVTGWVANANNANYATTVTGSSQGNITSLGTLTGLTVSGLTSLGPIGNITITGGTSGQVITTDGAGVLSFATNDTSRIVNGTSNVSIPVADGNVNMVVGGTQIIAVSGSGANVTGYVDVTGNINGNNVNAANLIIANGTVDATTAATGTIRTEGGIAAKGNIYAGKAVGFAHGSGNTDSAAYIQYNATANSLDFIFN
jgi:hypothetical protein